MTKTFLMPFDHRSSVMQAISSFVSVLTFRENEQFFGDIDTEADVRGYIHWRTPRTRRDCS